MNLINSLNNFYNSLSSDGIFFFWMLVFLLVFLVFLSIVLLVKNNKLTKIILEQKEKELTNTNLELKNNEEVELPKQELNISPVVDLEKNTDNSVQNKVELEKDNQPLKQDISEGDYAIKEEMATKVEERGLYKKNVLKEINAKMPTSPIHIEKEELDNESFMDIIEREDGNISPLLEMEDNYFPNENSTYLEEISKKLDDEPKPSNIELTEFEKKQEEEAIISYSELLKVKDKIYNITENEETDEFIDELKSLRLDLQ